MNIGKTIKYRKIDYSIYNREKLGLTNAEVVQLILSTNDYEYITSKCEDIEIDPNLRTQLILSYGNPLYTKNCIENWQALGLSSTLCTQLIHSIKDSQYIFENIFNWNLNIDDFANIYNQTYDSFFHHFNSTKIELPANMTIGIEIESLGRTSKSDIKRTLDTKFNGWKCKNDSSLKGNNENDIGIEVVSPVLTLDHSISTNNIKDICNYLTSIGQYTNKTCGGHIHIGANYLTDVQAWQNLLDLWLNAEKIIYLTSNTAGQLPRSGVPRYATPISKSLEAQINSGAINLRDTADINSFKRQLISSQDDRYKGINFYNLKEGGKQTIEFRLPNGTVDANSWIRNINLFGGMVKAAENLSIIQKKDISLLTQEEQNLLKSFENLRNKKNVLDSFLQIIVPQNSKSIYQERYKENSKQIQSSSMDSFLNSHISTEGIKTNPTTIYSNLFTGGDRITGEEFNTINQTIKRESEKRKNTNNKFKAYLKLSAALAGSIASGVQLGKIASHIINPPTVNITYTQPENNEPTILDESNIIISDEQPDHTMTNQTSVSSDYNRPNIDLPKCEQLANICHNLTSTQLNHILESIMRERKYLADRDPGFIDIIRQLHFLQTHSYSKKEVTYLNGSMQIEYYCEDFNSRYIGTENLSMSKVDLIKTIMNDYKVYDNGDHDGEYRMDYIFS